MRTSLCDQLDIEFPIFAFTHCRDVVAAVSNAGGLGVLGAVGFTPEQLATELEWLDEHCHRPYGVDVVIPGKYEGMGELDPVKEAALRMVPGSHKWEKPVLPMRWVKEEAYFPNVEDYMPVPDPEKEGMEIAEWEMQPGDAVAFNYDILHGSRGHTSQTRRRAFSLRLVGDDARYTERPGRTSPPFPDHGMVQGQKLREDWFPVIWPR